VTVRPKSEPHLAALVDRFVALAVDYHDALSNRPRRHSGQRPGIKGIKDVWMPVFTGMTGKDRRISQKELQRHNMKFEKGMPDERVPVARS
jgi:hypothetical protein